MTSPSVKEPETNIGQGIGDVILAAAFVAVVVVPLSLSAVVVGLIYIFWRIFS